MKISIGGKIVGVIEILFSIGCIAHFIWAFDQIEMDRVLDKPKHFIPVVLFISGAFKLIGVILIWLKLKIGIGFYLIGNLALISFFIYASTQLNDSEKAGVIVMYLFSALQFLFIYIMSKAIKS